MEYEIAMSVKDVSQCNATNYNLGEYEIIVTAQSANGETLVNQSKLWKVKTEGGKNSQNH